MPARSISVRSTWTQGRRRPAPFGLLPLGLPMLGLLFGLSGCNQPRRDEFAPACPRPALAPGASDITRYREGSNGHDITDLVLEGRITGVNGDCSAGDRGHLAANTTVVFQFSRGPGMQGRTATVPFFVAVSEGDDIRDKQIYSAQVSFPPNVDQTTLSTPPIAMSFPIASGKSGASYTIWAGFQLTEDELSVNRQRGAAQ
jgi:hypothetical protein